MSHLPLVSFHMAKPGKNIKYSGRNAKHRGINTKHRGRNTKQRGRNTKPRGWNTKYRGGYVPVCLLFIAQYPNQGRAATGASDIKLRLYPPRQGICSQSFD